jgi:glycosyltransferase involved in cell wall biosynthesis
MKIVYISYSNIPSREANSIHVMKICQAMALNGHEVILFAPKKKVAYENDIDDLYDFYGVKNCFKIKKISCIPIKGKSFIYSFLAAKRAKKIKPDLVYSRITAGSFFSSIFKIPNILELHEPLYNLVDLFFFKNLVQNDILKRVIVISDALKKYYIKKYPILVNKILVSPDAADPIDINLRPLKIENPHNKLLVGYTGNLYNGRGMEIVLQLAKCCSWAEFHIVGGSVTDVYYWRERFLILDNVTLHGFVPQKKVYSYALAFDVLLAPYQRMVSTKMVKKDNAKWMSPLKIFEYMSTGKAIIASDLPVLREVLNNNFAILVSPDNIKEWEEALIRLRDDHHFRKQLGQKAEIEFQKKYTWKKRAIKVIKNIK